MMSEMDEKAAFFAGMTVGIKAFGEPGFDPEQAWQKYLDTLKTLSDSEQLSDSEK